MLSTFLYPADWIAVVMAGVFAAIVDYEVIWMTESMGIEVENFKMPKPLMDYVAPTKQPWTSALRML